MSIRSTLSRLLKQSGPDMRQMRPRLSVEGVTIAIPNWNHEFLLARSVHSALKAVAILRESGIGAEVIISDDASRDGSTTLLRQLEARHSEDGFKVILQQDNTGPSYLRNMMLIRATYRYVLFLDADNEVVPESVPIFLQAIKDTGAAVVYGNLIIKTHGIEGVRGLHSNQSYTDHIFEANYIDNMALYDRVQLADMGGYLPEKQIVEDWELFNHLATNGRLIVFVPAMLGVYYELPQSFVREFDREYNLKLIARMKRIYDQFGMRKQQIIKTRHLRYHPDVGYII